MKKNYLIFFFLSNFLFAKSVNAQKEPDSAVPVKPLQTFGTNFGSKTTADCDTVNYPLPGNWSLTYYMVGSPAGDGYVAGTNEYDNKQKANYFDLSASSFMYIYGASFYFGVANSAVAANLAKNVMFKVYTDNGGSPGDQIGSTVDLPLSSIKANVDSGIMTNVTFPFPIALPSTKKFYVSVDISNFNWYNGDSITLVTTQIDEVNPGTAWEQESDDSWKRMSIQWGNLALIILPYVSVSIAGCNVLPVKLLSFNAEKENNDVLLRWQTSDEYNMKEYEIQKADNNNHYKTIAIISARNDSKNENYTYKDETAFIVSSTVQYRLKQIDNNGKVEYSKIISVKALSTAGIFVFPNPYSGVLKLQVNMANAQMVAINIYNMQGLLVAFEKPVFLNSIVNTTSVPSAALLKNGVYFLKLTIGTEQFVYKIVKE